MLEKALCFVLFLYLYLTLVVKVNASVLYFSPLDGSDNFTSTWSIVPGELGGTFSTNGLSGKAHYHFDIGTQNVVLKATINITRGSIASFRCRENFDRSTIEQATYQDNVPTGITEGINSNFYNIANFFLGQIVGIHNYELDCIGNTITSKLDGISNSGTSSPLYPKNTTYIGLFVGPGTTISNLAVCDSINCSYPSFNSLPVPLIHQYDLPSGIQIYDSANIWSPSTPFIGNWGCALTSATMVLQYYGITKMPDDSPLSPETLNLWLKAQADGYIGNGLVNWIALTRLTQIAKLAQNNPTFTADALEYKRVGFPDTTALATDLQNQQPDILEEPGHFIVATGTTGNTYTINDPYYDRHTLLDGYNNTFSHLIRFIPSHTDLSYIMIVTDPSVSLTLKDSNGNSLGNEYIQNPIEDDKNPGQFSSLPIKILEYSQPTDGMYSLSISGAIGQDYTTKAYFYDQSGNVKVEQISGKLHNPSDTYTLTFSKNDDETDGIEGGKKVTILSNDLDMLLKNHFIDNGSYQSLSSVSQSFNKNLNNPALAQSLLGVEINLLRAKHNHGISDLAFTILQADIQTLLNTL